MSILTYRIVLVLWEDFCKAISCLNKVVDLTTGHHTTAPKA